MHDVVAIAERLLASAPSQTKVAAAPVLAESSPDADAFAIELRKLAHAIRVEGVTVNHFDLDDVLSGSAVLKIASDAELPPGSAISRSPLAAEARALAAELRKFAAEERRLKITSEQKELESEVVAIHEKRANDAHTTPVPLIAKLPVIGPIGAVVTAPRGSGLEAGVRSWAGQHLGGIAGGLAGALGGAALGAGAGAIVEDEDPSAAATLGTLGIMLGLNGGILAGMHMGADHALRPIYNPDPTRVTLASADLIDSSIEKLAMEYAPIPYAMPAQPEQRSSRATPGMLAAVGAAGAGGALIAPSILDAMRGPTTTTATSYGTLPEALAARGAAPGVLPAALELKPKGDAVDALKDNEHLQHLVNQLTQGARGVANTASQYGQQAYQYGADLAHSLFGGY